MQTAIKKVRVECSDLSIGMYICELDRPWLDSPFLLQGFYIKDLEDIDTVRDICDYVFVDKIVEHDKLNNSLPGASSAVLMSMETTRPADSKPGIRMSRAAAHYSVAAGWEQKPRVGRSLYRVGGNHAHG